jgi:hypothetical protein
LKINNLFIPNNSYFICVFIHIRIFLYSYIHILMFIFAYSTYIILYANQYIYNYIELKSKWILYFKNLTPEKHKQEAGHPNILTIISLTIISNSPIQELSHIRLNSQKYFHLNNKILIIKDNLHKDK